MIKFHVEETGSYIYPSLISRIIKLDSFRFLWLTSGPVDGTVELTRDTQKSFSEVCEKKKKQNSEKGTDERLTR